MKKTSMQDVSELVKAKNGNELEQAAAVAVVAALITSNSLRQQATRSNWTGSAGLREGLKTRATENLGKRLQ